MAPERRPCLPPRRVSVVAVAALAWAWASAQAQTVPPPGAPAGPAKIFVCGKITSDRPILDCKDKDQIELNRDGSPKRIVPPTPTADERAEQEAREREANAERAARNDAIRRDRNLVNRFPNEAAHAKARAKALDDIGNAVRISEARIKLLQVERKPLLDEAEFYVGKPMPTKLKSSLDANDASLEAQKSLVQNQQIEIVRINALYDAELVRLKKLWGGAPPGSLGPLPAPPPASAAAPIKSASSQKPAPR